MKQIKEENLEKRLELIKDIKRFCTEELGIVENTSFTKIIPNAQAYHSLCVSHKDRIESIFEEDDKLYKSKSWCKHQAKKYEELGFDTYMGVVTAVVDNLGENTGDTTQITQSLLSIEPERLLHTMLHENFHIEQRKNKTDQFIAADIEEPIADCVAHQGSLIYYRNNPEMITKIKETKRSVERYNQWYNKHAQILRAAYKRDHIKGRDKLLEARAELEKIRGRKAPFINNAYFLNFTDYTTNAKKVENILRFKDPKTYIKNIINAGDIYTIRDLYQAVNPIYRKLSDTINSFII